MNINPNIDISSRAMLVAIQISKIGGTKVDKVGGLAYTSANNMAQDAIIQSKRLFTGADLKPISSVCNEVKVISKKYTLPWNDYGMRMLPNSVFTEFEGHMIRLQDKFNVAVQDMVARYDRIIEDAKVRLNGSFNQDDYPTHIEDKFKFNLEICPMPTGEALRIDCISDEKREAMQEERNKKTMELMKKSAAEVVHRMVESITILIQGTDGKGGLQNKDARFHQSAIDRVVEILDIAPSLNLLDNPELNQMIENVRSIMKPEQLNVKEIRESDQIRDQVTDDSLKAVMEIKDAMVGFC